MNKHCITLYVRRIWRDLALSTFILPLHSKVLIYLFLMSYNDGKTNGYEQTKVRLRTANASE